MESNRNAEDPRTPWLRLALAPGLSALAAGALLKAYGGAQAALAAPLAEVAALAGSRAARALAQGASPGSVEAALRWAQGEGRHVVILDDAAYPPILREIADPPLALFAIGRLELLRAPCLAIVGSRNATTQGRRDAAHFAAALSDAGLTIVSGLARGIDAAAHRGGLLHAGSSLAVLGCGPDIRYPKANAALAEQLEREGCVVSEFPLGTPPFGGNFPQRNRLISGLSLGVLVVEAAARSGSLGTACAANRQGRDVFAIPGSIHAPLAKGCHWLIREGATLVEQASEVLTALDRAPPAGPVRRPPADADPVLDAMGFAPVSLDQVVARCGLDVPALAARIMRLEMDGQVAALGGGLFQRLVAED